MRRVRGAMASGRAIAIGFAMLALGGSAAGCAAGCKGAPVTERKPAAPEVSASAAPTDDEPNADDSGDDGAEGQGDAPLPPIAQSPATVIAAGALADEAARELAAVRTSAYAHRTSVDEAAGAFDFDCSGFVVYALRRAAPSALEPLRARSTGRPLARDFVTFFASGDSNALRPWHVVSSVAALRRGDVIAWRKPADVVSNNTGHVMIALGPARRPRRSRMGRSDRRFDRRAARKAR